MSPRDESNDRGKDINGLSSIDFFQTGYIETVSSIVRYAKSCRSVQ